jgi:hypothetical protein
VGFISIPFLNNFFFFLQDVRNQDHLRYTLVTALCVPIVHVMSTSLQIQVFTKHICTLTDIVFSGEEGDKSKDPKDKSKSKGLTLRTLATARKRLLIAVCVCVGRDSQMELEEPSEEEQRTALIQRICAFSLVEALYASLPGNTIRKSINPVYAKTKLRKKDAEVKGNELTSDIMRAAHAIYTRKGVKDEGREREASQSQMGEGMEVEPVLADDTAGDQRADGSKGTSCLAGLCENQQMVLRLRWRP